MLSEELGIPSGNVIPTMNGYNACASSLSPGLKVAASSLDNPAARLGGFLQDGLSVHVLWRCHPEYDSQQRAFRDLEELASGQ